MGDGPELDRGGVNQGVGPGKLQSVQPFAEGQHPRLLDQRQVGGVVDGQLHGVPVGQGDHVDTGEGGGSGPQQGAQAQPENLAEPACSAWCGGESHSDRA